MFSIRKNKNQRGFILIYVLFIGSLCISISAVCYKMEYLIRSNNLKLQNNSLKVDAIQMRREHLLTQLDEYIYNNVTNLTEEEIKKYFSNLTNFSTNYEECYVKYIDNKNCFLLVYYLNHNFYKEELYEYRINNGSVLYGCIDYSFNLGGIQ